MVQDEYFNNPDANSGTSITSETVYVFSKEGDKYFAKKTSFMGFLDQLDENFSFKSKNVDFEILSYSAYNGSVQFYGDIQYIFYPSVLIKDHKKKESFGFFFSVAMHQYMKNKYGIVGAYGSQKYSVESYDIEYSHIDSPYSYKIINKNTGIAERIVLGDDDILLIIEKYRYEPWSHLQ
jgi:hypothetical protein